MKKNLTLNGGNGIILSWVISMGVIQTAIKYFLCLFICLISCTTYAQYRGDSFIYGQIKTSSGEELEGFIELFSADQWDDMLIADKDNPNFFVDRLDVASKLSYFREQNKASSLGVSREWNEVEPIKFEFLSSLWNAMTFAESPEASIPFIIQWGQVSRIEIHDDLCSVFLKNGNNHFVKIDKEHKIQLSTELTRNTHTLSEIESIDFERSPKRSFPLNKSNLYGTVYTKHGVFEGNLQFNAIEKQSIFDLKINAMEVDRTGMLLIDTLGSERIYEKMDLKSTFVSVKNFDWGTLDIPFSEVKSIQIEKGADKGGHFDRYKSSKGLFATILTKNGMKFSGYTVYDLNKTESAEILIGNNENMIYQIPIEKIAKIEPNNFKFTIIELKSGGKLTLGESPDVSISNQGILLYKDRSLEKEQQYLQWSDVDIIYFE